MSAAAAVPTLLFLALGNSRGPEGSGDSVTGAVLTGFADLWDRRKRKVTGVVRKSKRADVSTAKLNKDAPFSASG